MAEEYGRLPEEEVLGQIPGLMDGALKEAKATKQLIKDEAGSTASSLSLWRNRKGEMGKIREASCEKGGHLRIVGDDADMDLSGCTCGYSGTGPQGTAEILKDMGIFPEKAWSMAQLEAFVVSCLCPEVSK